MVVENVFPIVHKGKLRLIDGKARLISEIFCDGIGTCIGHCPKGAITTEERDAEKYDENKVMQENIIKAGKNTIIAHLQHLKDHGETGYLTDAFEVLKEIEVDSEQETDTHLFHPQWCHGTKLMGFSDEKKNGIQESGSRVSQLKQWPVQFHLVPHIMHLISKVKVCC